MAVVGHAGAAANTNSLSLTMPTVTAGDVAWLCQNNSDGGTFTTPSGWTLVESGTIGNMRWARYRKIMVSGDSGATLNLASTNTAKRSAIVVVLDGATGTESVETPLVNADNTTASTRTNPSTTVSGSRQALSFVFGRGNNPPTAWTAPSGWTLLRGAYNTASGATTMAVAYRTVTAGSVGGDTWTANNTELRAGTSIIIPTPTDALFLGTTPVKAAYLGTTSKKVYSGTSRVL